MCESITKGILVEDKITFENMSFNGVFGAIWEASGSFSSSPDVDGILGMSFNSDLSVTPLQNSLCKNYQ